MKFEVECQIDLNGTLSVTARTVEPPDLDLENQFVVTSMTQKRMNQFIEIWKQKCDLLDKRDEEYFMKIEIVEELKSIENDLRRKGKISEANDLIKWLKLHENDDITVLKDHLNLYK